MTASHSAPVPWQVGPDFSQVLLDAFPAFIVTVSTDGRVRLMNQAMLEALGYARAEVLGAEYGPGFVAAQDQQALAGMFEQLRASRQPVVHVSHALARDGRHIPVEWHGRPFLLDDGGLHFYFLVGFDLTERYRAEEQRRQLLLEQSARAQAESAREQVAMVLSMLKRTEERYRAFVEHSTEGIWCFEADEPLDITLPEDEQIREILSRARLVECNDAMGRMYGFNDSRPLMGTPLREMLVDSQQNLEMLRAFIRGGYRLEDAESCEPDRAGNFKYYSNNLVGIIENGRLRRAWGTQRDITERKRAQEVLRRNERLATMGRMAATIAHEINNPLESVTNLLYLLGENLWLDENARQYVTQAQEEVGRVSQIVGRTLGLQRESSEPVPVKVSDLFDNVLELYANKIAMRRVSVTRRYDCSDSVPGFPGQLRQVFSNLLLNAVDAAGPGGKVGLRIRRGCERKPTPTPGVRVSIADNGPGIRREDRARLFEPFFTTKGERGNGLGLWISRGVVEAHSGSMRFRSSTQPGRSGTVFTVFLPFTAAPRPLPPQTSVAAD